MAIDPDEFGAAFVRWVLPALASGGPVARHLLHQAAHAKNPMRWSQHTQNWSPIAAVTLNPERDGVVAATTTSSKSMPLAA